jgi:hypothetical protein
MGLATWIAIAVIVLVAIGLGVGVFFSGLIRGAEIIGQNPAVQNASEEAQEFVTDRTEIDGTDVIVITTSEARYDAGEPVAITVRNIGDHTQVITELQPDESKTVTWDEDAPAGDYTATVHTTADQGITAQASFTITG